MISLTKYFNKGDLAVRDLTITGLIFTGFMFGRKQSEKRKGTTTCQRRSRNWHNQQ